MSSLKDVRAEAESRIGVICQNAITQLITVWTRSFGEKSCIENVQVIPNHIQRLCDEIISESVVREDNIKQQIADLQAEASALRRLLHVEIPLDLPPGVPLQNFRLQLDESLDALREQLLIRKNQIVSLLLEQETLCEELGVIPRELLDDPLPTEQQLHEFGIYLSDLQATKLKRLENISDLRRDIKHLLKQLETEPCPSDVDLLQNRNAPLTTLNIERLRTLRDEYQKQAKEIRESIENMKKILNDLWSCLDTSPTVKQKFEKYTDYTQTIYQKFCREVERCEHEKRQNIKRFVDNAREKIIIWWDKTMKSEIERKDFKYFNNTCYTEDLLKLHEYELEDIKNFYQNNEKIYNLITERTVLWDRMNALEAKASDPGRFNNRGGQLLKEEKERKVISSKLPKIESELQELVQAFEKQHNKKFLIWGEDILEIIQKDWDKKIAEKEKHMSARKNAATGTPMSSAVKRTPLTAIKTHSIMMSLKKTNSTANFCPSVKRKNSQSEDFPCAKRTLFNDINRKSPIKSLKTNKLLEPCATVQNKARTPRKSSAKKRPVVGSLINSVKRKSGRQSGSSSQKQSRSGKKAIKVPVIKVTSLSDNSMLSSTTSYDSFQIEVPARSTINQSEGVKTRRCGRQEQNKHQKGVTNLPNPRNVLISKSPRERTDSPVAGPSGRHLSTKNLPIII